MKLFSFSFFLLLNLSLWAQVNNRTGLTHRTSENPESLGFPCAGTTLFEENFENGLPAGWSILDLDGKQPNSNIDYLQPGWQSILDFKDSSNHAMASPSWYAAPDSSDDWLITPMITLGNNTCLSWAAYSQDGFYTERYEVRISTTTPDTAGFFANPRLPNPVKGEINDRNYRSLNLAQYANQSVYIAFRQTSYDKFVLVLDDVRFSEVLARDLSMYDVKTVDTDTSKTIRVWASVLNLGSDTLSFDSTLVVHYQVGNNAVLSDTVLRLIKLAPNDSINFSNERTWKTPNTVGTYELCVWFSDIGSQPVMNDSLCKWVGVGTTDIPSAENPSFLIYPNPASTVLNIHWENQASVGVKLWNMQGQMIWEETGIKGNEYQLSLEGFPAGVYVIRCQTEDGKWFSQKIIKE